MTNATLASQGFWRNYLATQDSYGTYEDRSHEYNIVTRELATMGLMDDDVILDVGAGSCDMDHFLRTEHGWRGKYIPVDGAVGSGDLNEWEPPRTLTAEWVVSIQTIEHLHSPRYLIGRLKRVATRGIVVTTPNPAVVDVLAVDPTHVTPVSEELLKSLGANVSQVEFCGRGNGKELDTLIAVWDFTQSN